MRQPKYIEAAYEDALQHITDLEQEITDQEARAERAEWLFTELWWIVKKTDDSLAEQFRKDNPQMGAII